MAADHSLPTIGMLWMEGRLSFLEQMCMLSFVEQGHRLVLFHYGQVENVPSGVELVSANEVHEPKQFIVNNQFNTPVPQSDIFRLQLMKKTDFLWCDTDVVALAPIPKADHIFGYFNRDTICNAVMRLPPDSPALNAYVEYSEDPYPIRPWVEGEEREELERMKRAGELPHASDQEHSVYGPGVMTWYLRQHDELKHASPIPVFYPLPFRQAGQANDIHVREFRGNYIKDDTLAVHLWGRRMRWWIANGIKRHSFLDRRLRNLGIRASDAPLPRHGRKGPKPIEFPANLPALRATTEDIRKATGGAMSTALLSDREDYLKAAQAELDKITTDNLYGVNDPPPPGCSRGWDFYGSDAARLNALALSMFNYAESHRHLPDLCDPNRFSEKLLIMKLFGAVPHAFVADNDVELEKVSDILTVPKRVWHAQSPTLPDALKGEPGEYCLKGSASAAHRIGVSLPLEDAERDETNNHLAAWHKTKTPEGFWTGDWWRVTSQPIYCLEEDLSAGDQSVSEWRFWVIAGRVHLVQVDRDRGRGRIQMLHDRNYTYLADELLFPTSSDTEPRPAQFDDMIRIAEAMAKDVELARVDFSLIEERICLREVALSPLAGKQKIRSDALDQQLGAAWTGTALFPSNS
ncbi:ATP-grasp fold amidoligase family protein [Ruegeria sp. 6PALISEP08]|uniref:ATP-grasp fold amidoligase family protein n=1 Tax=Ruegeria sp. 6PALISEP08 TaxID=1225660 RepID=UPI00067F69BC|nr:ATP-grasp fold amidoligase family protein [Ruegeria sp. 6PALISEP08]